MGAQYQYSIVDNTGQQPNDFHLGLAEYATITSTSSSPGWGATISHPALDPQGVQTLIDYAGAAVNGGTHTFYYSHEYGASSVKKARWTKDNVELANYSRPGSSESGHFGSTAAEWVVNLDNGMAPGYVAEYNGATGQSLTGRITISTIEYALRTTPYSVSQLEYSALAGQLTPHPTNTVQIDLGNSVDLAAITGVKPYQQWLVLRYEVEFTGDTSGNVLYHASQFFITPEPSTAIMFGLCTTVLALRPFRRH